MNVDLLWWFTLGLLLGWLIEWLIDRAYWRRRLQTMEYAARRESEAAARLRAELDGARANLAEFDADLRAARADAAADLARLAADLENARASMADQEQRTTELWAKSRSDAERVAAQLAERDEQIAARDQQLLEREGKLAERDGKIERFRQREAEFRRAVETLRDVLARTRHELRQERSLKLSAVLPGGDPLIDIDGIGPVFQQRLYDAGVNSFARLAAMTPQEVRTIIAPQPWQELNPAAWIAEAATRARAVRRDRDPLADIKGVGPAYERRLYEAGVSTFAELAVLTPDHLRALFRPQERSQIDAEAWIAEARELAIQVRSGSYRKGVA